MLLASRCENGVIESSLKMISLSSSSLHMHSWAEANTLAVMGFRRRVLSEWLTVITLQLCSIMRAIVFGPPGCAREGVARIAVQEHNQCIQYRTQNQLLMLPLVKISSRFFLPEDIFGCVSWFYRIWLWPDRLSRHACKTAYLSMCMPWTHTHTHQKHHCHL